jgi:hypothetical protein
MGATRIDAELHQPDALGDCIGVVAAAPRGRVLRRTPSTAARGKKPQTKEMRGSGEALAKEPWTHWRFWTATSPRSQSMGTASGRRVEPPLSATRARMSTRPSRWVPGMVQRVFAGVVRRSCAMKFTPWTSGCQPGLSQCVVPS